MKYDKEIKELKKQLKSAKRALKRCNRNSPVVAARYRQEIDFIRRTIKAMKKKG